MAFLDEYQKHVEEREALGVPPLPLTKEQTAQVIEEIKNNGGEEFIALLKNRVSPGVDDAAYVKADFLNAIVQDKVQVNSISKLDAIEMLGQMLGGFNVAPLIEALKLDDEVAKAAANALKNTLLVYDAFHDVADLHKSGNKFATEVIESWANAEWFLNRPKPAEKITVTVFKVPGETNTDDNNTNTSGETEQNSGETDTSDNNIDDNTVDNTSDETGETNTDNNTTDTNTEIPVSSDDTTDNTSSETETDDNTDDNTNNSSNPLGSMMGDDNSNSNSNSNSNDNSSNPLSGMADDNSLNDNSSNPLGNIMSGESDTIMNKKSYKDSKLVSIIVTGF